MMLINYICQRIFTHHFPLQESFVKGATMVKVVFAWQLFYIGGCAAFKSGIMAIGLQFQAAVPAFFLWQTLTSSVCAPLIFYLHDSEMRSKVSKMIEEKFHELLET